MDGQVGDIFLPQPLLLRVENSHHRPQLVRRQFLAEPRELRPPPLLRKLPELLNLKLRRRQMFHIRRRKTLLGVERLTLREATDVANLRFWRRRRFALQMFDESSGRRNRRESARLGGDRKKGAAEAEEIAAVVAERDGGERGGAEG